MEYQQRLRRKRRAVLATDTEPHVGTRLWRDAAIHGAQAIGQPVGAIAAGRRADWLVLDPHHPSLAGAAAGAALDHLMFAGGHAAIRDVMVAGRWVVRHGHHEAEAALGEKFAKLWAVFFSPRLPCTPKSPRRINMLATVKPRLIRAARGKPLSARHWTTEAPLRMLMNNLDPEVAENPAELVVYGGIGRAARDWQCFDRIVETLKMLGDEETLLVQSGKPVGVFQTHADAPRVLIANSNLVPHWATWEHFHELDRLGLAMYGQMTAGSWIYIGSQGIVQGTYETFAEMGRRHFGGNLAGKWILTAGLGGMGGAQPLAATMAGASMLAVECRQSRIAKRLETGYVDMQAHSLDEALGAADGRRRRQGRFGRLARQRRRRARADARARHQARCAHRPNLGA